MKRWLGIGVLLLLAGGLGWRLGAKSQAPAGGPGGMGGGAPGGGAAQGRGGGAGGGSRNPVVQTATAGPATLETVTETVGTIESPAKSAIAPRSSGRIQFLEVRPGDRVTAGQVLVRIDPAELEGQVNQAQSAAAEARARLAQAQLGQGPATVGVEGQIAQQQAQAASAAADLKQVTANTASRIAVANAALLEAQARLRSTESDVRGRKAIVGREEANVRNAQAKADRAAALLEKGYISKQAADDARTALDVAQSSLEAAQTDVQGAQEDVVSAKEQVAAAQSQLAIVQRQTKADLAAATARNAQAQSALKLALANRSQTGAYRENLRALQAGVQAADASLSQARARMAETTLRAPSDGIVTERNSDVGSLASPGQPVLVVQSLDSLFVSCSLTAEQAARLTLGTQARILVGGKTVSGQVTHINGAADPQSRQIGVLAALSEKGAAMPGEFCRVSFVTGSTKAAVAVPREAVREGQDAATVAVVGADMKASVRPVKLGARSAAFVEVLEGVSAGDKVVILSYDPVRDGQTVQLPGSGRGGGQGGGQPGGARTRGGQ